MAAGVGLSAVPAEAWRAAAHAGKMRRVQVVPPIRPSTVALIMRKGPADPRLDVLRRALDAGAARASHS